MAEIKNKQQTNKYITLKYAVFKDGNKQSERAENKREVGVREDFSEEVTEKLSLRDEKDSEMKRARKWLPG